VCHSTCTQQLAECKRTCPGGGQERRDCRAACAERSTCTAPGARIRTLAYVVNECTTDPQGRSSGLKQKLLVRRGNCDPVSVMEVAPSAPVPDLLGMCSLYGSARNGAFSIVGGAFQRLAVLPDGSGVVFEVTTQFSVYPTLSPEPAPGGEGIFLVRADGSGLRRLGPASRFPTFVGVNDVNSPIGISFPVTGMVYSVSPNGRSIALIDLGPDTAGHEAPQIFLLDLRSGRRTQLTHLSRVASGGDLRFPSFLDNRTIGFYSGYSASPGSNAPLKAYLVKTDGTGVHEVIPTPTAVPGAHVVPQFGVTGARQQILLVTFPDKRPVDPGYGGAVTELFLSEGKNLLQLTDFGRGDTGVALSSFIDRGRVFFIGSANPPPGENPAGICQVFSINSAGGDLRQVTHLPSDGRPPNTGCFNGGPAVCTIDREQGVVPDRVTGTMLFGSSCDPVGGNPFGDQVFAMRLDGSGLRQLTATRGMTIDPDGTVRVELPGPFAYARRGPG
jgi:hypothetical protein